MTRVMRTEGGPDAAGESSPGRVRRWRCCRPRPSARQAPSPRALIDAGWSPGAAVTIRITIAAVILAVPAIVMLRGRWHVLRRNIGMVAIYGLVAIAGCQVFYFNAVQHLSVGVALLLEYMGIVLVVGWLWIRSGQRAAPADDRRVGGRRGRVGAGARPDRRRTRSTSSVCSGVWVRPSASRCSSFCPAKSDSELPPLAMASGGMTIGAVTLIVLGAVGVLPMQANTDDVEFAGQQVSWLVPVLGLSVIAAALAYVVGISAARILGSKLSSFVGLTEVLFAVLFAWLFLGQLPTLMQLAGGVLIIAGVALVRIDELRSPTDDFEVVASGQSAVRRREPAETGRS